MVQLVSPKSQKCILALTVACMITCNTAGAQPRSDDNVIVGLPPKVRSQLQRNATVMSAAHLEYNMARTGASAENYAGPTSYSCYTAGPKFYQRRLDIVRDPNGEVRKAVHEDSFDGKVFYFGDPELPPGGHPAILGKYLADDATDPERYQFGMIYFPYLLASGFYMPVCVAGLPKHSSVESLVLRYVNAGTLTKIEQVGEDLRVTVQTPDPILAAARKADLEQDKKALQSGRNSPQKIAKELQAREKMKKMVPSRTVVFTLVQKYGYAVAEREEWTADGKRICRVVSEGWKHYDGPDIWLPTRCVESYWTYPWGIGAVFADSPLLTLTVQLASIEFGPPQNVSFVLNYKKPGTVVRDRTVPEARKAAGHQVTYEVPADGATLRDAAGKALGETEHGTSRIWVWINVIALIVLVVIFGIRRMKKARGH